MDFAQFSSTLEDGTTHIDKTLLVCGYGVVDNKRTRYVEPHCTEMNIKKPETCSLTVTSSMLCGSWDNKDSNGKYYDCCKC